MMTSPPDRQTDQSGQKQKQFDGVYSDLLKTCFLSETSHTFKLQHSRKFKLRKHKEMMKEEAWKESCKKYDEKPADVWEAEIHSIKNTVLHTEPS